MCIQPVLLALILAGTALALPAEAAAPGAPPPTSPTSPVEIFTPSGSSVQPLAAYRTAGRRPDLRDALRRRTVASLTAAHVEPALLRAG